MTKKNIIACLSVFIFFNSYGANFFSNSFDLYSCSTEDDAKNCTKCKPIKDATMQVEVNVEKSVVLVTYYDGSKNLGSNSLENCKIVDKKNWQCGNDGSYDQIQTFTQDIKTMTKGKFYSIHRFRSRGIPSSNIKPLNLEDFICSK